MEKLTLVERFNSFMTSDTKGAEIGIYSISGALLVFAYYKIRPITKFGKASDIPTYFIKNKLKQRGVIASIEPNIVAGSLLKVNHKPPLNIVFSNKTLPVKLCGVQINANGFSWLQSVAVNKKIHFIPIKKAENYAECQVFLIPQEGIKTNLDLIGCLTQLGFAQVIDKPITYKDKELQNYIRKLIQIENRAKKQRAGSWSMSIPPPSWPVKMIEKLIEKIKLMILPERYRLPELVR